MTTNNPYEPSQSHAAAVGSARPAGGCWKWAIGLSVLGLLLAMLFFPASRGSVGRKAARLMGCDYQLRTISRALRNYAEDHGTLPPAYTVDAQGRPLHSWRTLILPYLDEQTLYNQIDLHQPWDAPANQAARSTIVEIYRCPARKASPYETDYLAVVGPDRLLRDATPLPLREAEQYPPLTVMLTEVPATRAVHWMSPTDISANELASFSADTLVNHGAVFNASHWDVSTKPYKFNADDHQGATSLQEALRVGRPEPSAAANTTAPTP